METGFVNINGDPVRISAVKQSKPRARGPEEFHKGWKVVGIAPGSYEQAVAERQRQQVIDAKCESEVRKDLPPYESWKLSAKLTPVRSKPYEIPESAQQCKELAIKAGWDRVFVVEIKKEYLK